MTKIKGSVRSSPNPRENCDSVPPEQCEYRKKKWNLSRIVRPWAWKKNNKKHQLPRHNSLPLGKVNSSRLITRDP